MFSKILLFEIQNRIRRPAFYLYFAGVLLFSLFSFATGSLPVGEKEHINAPHLIAFWCSAMTMMMTLVSSSVMGTAIYRDIEYQTKDYYLTYPLTKAGYFWGRYLGSFIFMVGLTFAMLLGIWLGTLVGPAIGKTDASQYGPNRIVYYLYPLLTVALPNIFFTSSLFFGLVAWLRNVKVIYFGGILLFLFYLIGLFFLNNINDPRVIAIVDPFALNGLRYQMNNAGPAEQNAHLILIHGPLLVNRFLWTAVGAVTLIITCLRFNFVTFFQDSTTAGRTVSAESPRKTHHIPLSPKASFAASYNRNTFWSLTRLELMNILRDNYFWIILTSGSIFLVFIFWLGTNDGGVPDYPRTVSLLGIFNEGFPFFIFFIILFYTGEMLHRDRTTRYAFINDALPPSNRLLNGSKAIALLMISAGFSLLPLLAGILVQLVKGFHALNFAAYASYLGLILLPKCLEMALLCYFIHMLVNNKFAAHAIAACLWTAIYFLDATGIFNYHLLLYACTPGTSLSDMDGMGHMKTPLLWFDTYWLLFAVVLSIATLLLYNRGVSTSLKERIQLVRERFDNRAKWSALLVLLLLSIVGSCIYYNISYRNEFLTQTEQQERAVLYEKTLKHYDSLPLPKITRIRMDAALFPEQQQEIVHAMVTMVNKNQRPVSQLLLDGDQLSDYTLAVAGKPLHYSIPLWYARGTFSPLRPKKEPADFRLYQLAQPLAPGDSVTVEITSSVVQHGFTNGLFAANVLRNGIFFTGGLPGLGYDDDDEVSSPYVRKKNGLPPREEAEIPLDSPTGTSTLAAGRAADLFQLDLTVSTAADQTAVGPGELVGSWSSNGRRYFHYTLNRPGTYAPFAMLSAHYAEKRDSILLDHKVQISIFYDPAHSANIDRFVQAYKDGLSYYSAVYGSYPHSEVRLVETSVYGPREASMPTMDSYAEYFGWNADLRNPNLNDYCYLNTLGLLAQQWWRFQVAPNSTTGALTIPEGMAVYDALVMAERKYGLSNMRRQLMDKQWYYLFIRRRMNEAEPPVIRANRSYLWGNKMGVVLYGLRDLIGDSAMNAALRSFKNAYAFRKDPPFAGSADLYHYLEQHVPDSFHYYLTDCWQKVTLYNNRMLTAHITKGRQRNQYLVQLTVDVDKVWITDKDADIPATGMQDYIDIGVFGKEQTASTGRTVANLLYLKKYKLTRGRHTIMITVQGQPQWIGIDPLGKLIDRNPGDNFIQPGG